MLSEQSHRFQGGCMHTWGSGKSAHLHTLVTFRRVLKTCPLNLQITLSSNLFFISRKDNQVSGLFKCHWHRAPLEQWLRGSVHLSALLSFGRVSASLLPFSLGEAGSETRDTAGWQKEPQMWRLGLWLLVPVLKALHSSVKSPVHFISEPSASD